MPLHDLIAKRFMELEDFMNENVIVKKDGRDEVNADKWEEWTTSVMNLLERAFGPDSVHARNFRRAYEESTSGWSYNLPKAKGTFLAAKSDFEGGYIFDLDKALSGEILGDFVMLAKAALKDGNKDVAAVLASAALEDAMKRYGRNNGIDVDEKSMHEVVSALKAKGIVSGAQKSLLDTMPKLRNYAMHANWEKLTTEDVGSIIGFVEQFLLSHFV
jgi:hypothetical protein